MSPRRNLLILFLLSLIITPAIALAEAGEKFTKDGYLFHVTANQMGSDILVRGSISDGDCCRKLIVIMSFQNEESDKANIKIIVNDYSGNDRFNVRKRAKAKRSSRWFVSGVQIQSYK